jgi:hypothetical protein
MLFSRFAQSAAAMLLLTIGIAAPAHAQNNKQIISGTWYEDRAASNNSVGTLTLTFTQTPTNQFLNVTNVACTVSVASAQTIAGIVLYAGTTSGAHDLDRDYAVMGNVTPQTVGGSKYYSVVQNGIFYKFGPGRFPSIEIDTGSTGTFSMNASCTIVGNLTDN